MSATFSPPQRNRPAPPPEAALEGRSASAAPRHKGQVILIDDDPDIVKAIAELLLQEGFAVERHSGPVSFLQLASLTSPPFDGPRCLVCDVKMPDMDGLELQKRLDPNGTFPMVFMSGNSGAPEAVSAFRAGAIDFLVKPVDADVLLAAVARALLVSADRLAHHQHQHALARRVASLTERERTVATRAAHGQTNPAIARALGLGLRTVKLHRQHAMEKLGANNLADLVRIADASGLK